MKKWVNYGIGGMAAGAIFSVFLAFGFALCRSSSSVVSIGIEKLITILFYPLLLIDFLGILGLVLGILLSLLQFFLIGVIIGFIIQKVRKR